MLLDRRKVKFWQRIVFGFMAFLMAAFLVVGYSGVLNGCTWFNSAESATEDARPADRQVPGRREDRPSGRHGVAEPGRAAGLPRQPGSSRDPPPRRPTGCGRRTPTPAPTRSSPSRRARPPRSSAWRCWAGWSTSSSSCRTTRRPPAVYGKITELKPKDAQSFFDMGDRRHQRGRHQHRAAGLLQVPRARSGVARTRRRSRHGSRRTRRSPHQRPLHRRPSKGSGP